MKKILMLFICLLLVGCEKNDITKFKEEYEALNNKSIEIKISEKAKVQYLEIEEVLDFFNNKTGIIYFGFPDCPWCRNILPVLLDVSIDNNEVIYYFNPAEVRGTNDETFNQIMNILDEYLEVDSEGEKTLYVPDVYFIKDGSIKGHFLGSVSSQTNPYETLTQPQKEELYNIYKELLDKIK